MWPNGGSGNEQFTNDFNNVNNFLPSPFGPFGHDGYFPQLQNNLPYGNGFPGLVDNGQNPNQGPFIQNNMDIAPVQSSSSPVGFLPRNVSTPLGQPSVALNARAAELKERLMKSTQLKKNTNVLNASSNAVAASSPSNPAKIPPASTAQEQDLDTMIFEHSKAALAVNDGVQADRSSALGPAVRPHTTTTNVPASRSDAQPRFPAGVTDTSTNGTATGNHPASQAPHVQSRQQSEMSEEAEIMEDSTGVSKESSVSNAPVPRAEVPAAQSVNTGLSPARSPVNNSTIPQPLYDEHSRKRSKSEIPTGPSRQTPQGQRNGNGTRPTSRPDHDLEARSGRDSGQRNRHDDNGAYDKSVRLKSLDRKEITRRPEQPEHNYDQIEEQVSPRLAQLLRDDKDLRDWLLITGFHDKQYRGNVLGNRRDLWELDAQRAVIIAKMAAAERPPPNPIQNPYMVPPSRLEGNQKPDTDALTTAREVVPSNKRPFDDAQASRRASLTEKAPRMEDRRGDRPKSREAEVSHWRNDRDDVEDRRPRRSRSRERFESPPRYGHGRNDRDTHPYDINERYQDGPRGFNNGFNRGRGRGRGRGRYQ